MERKIRLGTIGECMLELRQQSGSYVLGYGGDVFNTTVYASRLGVDVTFLTATGDDHYSQFLLNAWQSEGLSIDAVRTLPGSTPSLYIIETAAAGERTFHYWRDASPFRQWLSAGTYRDTLAEKLELCEMVYFSGISLALLTDADKQYLFKLLADYRSAGGKVCFDPNYRAKLWSSAEQANHWIDAAYASSDIAFPSLEDEVLLRGEQTNLDIVQRIAAMGVGEVILKDGARGACLYFETRSEEIAAPQVTSIVDTTAAGDAFNAGYLSARINGDNPAASAKRGCQIAAKIIQHRGAVIPSSVTLID